MHIFKEQVSTNIMLVSAIYWVGVIGVVLAIVGLIFLDGGLARAKNAMSVMTEKLLLMGVGGLAIIIVGYGIWEWQFYTALGIPNALSKAVEDWWLFSPNLNHFAGTINPAITPSADVSQVYAAFFIVAGAFVAGLFHSVATERVKLRSLVIMTVVLCGLVTPFVWYLTWGSVGPLSNRGTHDFVGIFGFYVLTGSWALVLLWRLGKRRVSPIPAEAAAEEAEAEEAVNPPLIAGASMLVIVGVCAFVPVCGIIVPGEGYFGISMTTSGFGLVLTNVVAAAFAGAVGGGILSYLVRNPVWVLIGPIAGYLSGTAMFDIGHPWSVALVALFAPAVAWGTSRLLRSVAGIEDEKIVPLTLGVGIYGAILAGFVGWHVSTGGYPGGKAGYEIGHSQISPWWQLVGVGVTLLVGLVSALATIVPLEKTIGIQVEPEVEATGLDFANWAPEELAIEEVVPGEQVV
jgi:ammonium transporter, Amt family